MLASLTVKNVGPAPELSVEWAQRLNLIVGDNGLGKSFLLDLSWWALTRSWSGPVALPTRSGPATIEHVVHGRGGPAKPVKSEFRREDQSWPVDAKRPPIPGIVLYIRIDGGFSVWDPARNYWRSDTNRPEAYHFSAKQVWEGLDLGEQRVCEGLERDWVNWQEGRKPQFQALEEVLRVLSPSSEQLRAGAPQRVFLGEGRERPTILVGKQTIPVALASAGVRRILALAYFLVWSWHEHRAAAKLLDKEPEERFVILFDEPETHLHPRWQRSILPSLQKAVAVLSKISTTSTQMLVASHSPLVAASIESIFEVEKDDLIHLKLKDGAVVLEQGTWAKYGDVSNLLVSDVFGMEHTIHRGGGGDRGGGGIHARRKAAAPSPGLQEKDPCHTPAFIARA